MIRVVSADTIDPVKWDQCILTASNGSIYGLYASLQVACPSWKGIIWGDYEAVLALPVRRKWMIPYSWHPQFMGPLGIFGHSLSTDCIHAFYNAVTANSWWVRMYYFQKGEGTKCKYIPRVHQMLEIDSKDISSIRKAYNDNTKRNLKKAGSMGMYVQDESDAGTFTRLFKEAKGDEIDTLNEGSYTLLMQLMQHWQKTGEGYIRSVYAGGEELQAMAYFICWNGVLTYYKGFSTPLGKQNGAMHFLLDHEIESRIRDLRKVDFGGSNVASVARFYKGFGGTDVEYYQAEYRKF